MTDRDAVRAGYDVLAETYAASREPDDDERAVLESFVAGLSDGDRVLDAGCGQGDPVLRRLAETSPAVGLDFSGAQLELAREAAPEATLVRGDLTALPFAADRFDAAVAAHSVIHLPLEAHGPAIEELARVLRPGGRLLLSEGTGEWVGRNPDWLDGGAAMEWSIAGAEATRGQLEAAGFAVDAERTTGDELSDDGTWTFFRARLAE